MNVRYLVAQQRIGEGRATMRIRFVLNDLNNSDDIVETHGFRVFNRSMMQFKMRKITKKH